MAYVVSIKARNGKDLKEGYSFHNNMIYTVGEVVRANNYDNNSKVVCVGGIHVFRSKIEAELFVY